jgi:hypothetical protein
MNVLEFSTAAAKAQAGEGHLEQWIYRYLESGVWANIGLREGLQKQPRWWIGPIAVELNTLNRCCGPEPSLEYRVPQKAWDDKVIGITNSLTDALDVPPLIVEYRAGAFIVRDGNHRHEAMRRKSWLKCWGLIWHNSQPDFEASQKMLLSIGSIPAAGLTDVG